MGVNSASQPGEQAAKASETAFALEFPIKMLVVAETSGDRDALRRMLGTDRFSVHEAASAQTAAAEIQSLAPRCIVMLHRPPGVDAPALVKSLLQPDGSLPCAMVVLAAQDAFESAIAAVKAGANDCLDMNKLQDGRLAGAVLSAIERYGTSCARQKINERNARLAALVNASDDAMISLSRDWRILSWNPAAERLFGFTEAEVLNQPYDMIVPPSHRAESLTTKLSVHSGKRAQIKETLRRDKSGSLIEVEVQASPIIHEYGHVAGIACVYRGLNGRKSQLILQREAQEATARLRESEHFIQSIVSNVQEGIWVIGADGRTKFANERLAAMLGVDIDDIAGRPVTDFCFPEDAETALERIGAGFEGHNDEFEFRFRRANEEAVHVLSATAPLKNRDGVPIGTLASFLDMTGRMQADERQRALIQESAHRSKNLLTVIQAIAHRSFTASDSIEDIKSAFIGRLHALSRTHNTLTGESFEGALIDHIVSAALETFGARAGGSGPQIMLSPKAAQIFALLLHELSTNAVKYGALSVPGGHIEVSWRIAGTADRLFEFDWVETGGPPASPPLRRGFGTTLISALTGAQLGCTPQLNYGESGFSYKLEAPLAQIGAALDESPVRQRLKSEILRAFYDSWASLRGAAGQLPDLAHFDRQGFDSAGGMVIVEISRNGSVHLVEAGRALTGRLGRSVQDDDFEGVDPTSMAEAYRRCARTSQPYYEHARFNFGDGDPVEFEHLLLPFSRTGRRVTHLAGFAVFTGETNN